MHDHLKRHAEFLRLEKAVRRCIDRGRCSPWTGRGFRFAPTRYAKPKEFLSGQGTWRKGSRWMAQHVAPVLYLSSTPELAMAEALRKFRLFGIPEWQAMPLVVAGVEVKISALLDLNDGALRSSLRFSSQRMVEERWQDMNGDGLESLTQALGRAMIATGVEGFIFPPATQAKGFNLAIFPSSLRRSSSIKMLP